ncbi:MAG: flagellar hook-length control protein FliK [Sulfitobacter sp.]
MPLAPVISSSGKPDQTVASPIRPTPDALGDTTELRGSTKQNFTIEPDELAAIRSAQTSVTPQRTELPQHIARQLAEVTHHLPSRPVEITLRPEELGRVRLSVTPSEHGIIVNVLAERPETLDLMRRHIGALAQEFQGLGYEDIAFSFSNAEQNPSNNEAAQSPESHKDQTAQDHGDGVEKNTQIHLTIGAATGLDLRL